MTDSERQARQEFIKHMLTHTVQLVRNAVTFPVDSGIGSGFLIPHGEDFLLITAGHLFDRDGAWTLETKLSGAGGTLHLPLRDLQLLEQVDMSTRQASRIDLAWANIRRADAVAAISSLKGGSVPLALPVYRGPLNCGVTTEEGYGFASWTQPVFDSNRAELERSMCYEMDLTMRDRDVATGVITFELARQHQGHDYYLGASGAPIADPEGRIVAVLMGGEVDSNVLYGMELRMYSSLFPVAPPG